MRANLALSAQISLKDADRSAGADSEFAQGKTRAQGPLRLTSDAGRCSDEEGWVPRGT